MKCAWAELVEILPVWIRQKTERHGRDNLQEIRLRVGMCPELVMRDKSVCLDDIVRREDLEFVVNTASRYSPWSSASSAMGYITAPGGHRIGLCGEAVIQDGQMTGLRELRSVCVRVARDFPGIASKLIGLSGSILIIGPPGCGKTTLLRDLIRQRGACSGCVCVVDERRELFPKGFYTGVRTDVLSGVGKADGIDCLLRTMNPVTIAVDEITTERDCVALSKAAWCGVDLLATAHAGSMKDLANRGIYKAIVDNGMFRHYILMQRDKSWSVERITA